MKQTEISSADCTIHHEVALIIGLNLKDHEYAIWKKIVDGESVSELELESIRKQITIQPIPDLYVEFYIKSHENSSGDFIVVLRDWDGKPVFATEPCRNIDAKIVIDTEYLRMLGFTLMELTLHPSSEERSPTLETQGACLPRIVEELICKMAPNSPNNLARDIADALDEQLTRMNFLRSYEGIHYVRSVNYGE